jgi:hypothetical protein
MPLPSVISDAVTLLWYSRYRPVTDLMLSYLSRNQDRNPIQHSAPSPAAAKTFIETSLQLPPEYLQAIALMIQSGTKKKNGELEYLFDHGDRDVEDPSMWFDTKLENSAVELWEVPKPEEGDTGINTLQEDEGTPKNKGMSHVPIT